MQTEPTTSPVVNVPAELTHKYAFIGQNALHLRIVEEFLTQMELTLLKTSPASFDIESIKSGLKELRSLESDAGERRKRLEFQISHELLRWQENLAKRDEKIEAYHIRRYCDGLRKPLESEVFVALARFYRSLGHSRQSMSKFDLAMTRAFSSQLGELRRCLVADRVTIASRIAACYTGWDRKPVQEHGDPKDVRVFERFIEECFSHDEFEGLTGSRLFDRVREFKAELSERFFHPNVVAAAVECNIALGNRLNVLMAKASENLGERLGSEFDFAGALQDTSPNAEAYISEALREIDTHESSFGHDAESDDVYLMRSILELAARADENAENVPGSGAEDNSGAEVVSTSRPQFRNILTLIDHQNPDITAIRNGFDEIDEFKAIDFNDFLFFEDGTPDTVSRDVLKVILSLESLRAHELTEKREISRNIRKEVLELLAKAENLGFALERAIGSGDRALSSRLLFVSNKLLETRLRLERSIVRFSSKNLGLAQQAHAPDKVIENEIADNLSYLDTGTMDANRWLIVATVAVAIFFFFMFFNGRSVDVAASVASDVEQLEPSGLPGGKNLTGAHRQGPVLYAVGTDAWRRMSDEEKTDALKDLLSAPLKTRAETVMVVDDQGNLMADISQRGVNLVKNPPSDETGSDD